MADEQPKNQAQRERKVIEADEFVVRDEKGQVRIRIGVDNSGNASVRLYADDEKPRVSVEVVKNGLATIGLHDDEQVRSHWTVDESGDILFLMNDSSGQIRVDLSELKGQGTAIVFRDSSGKPKAALGVLKEQPGLFLDLPENEELS